MNKARRHELKMLKYKKRLKNYCLKEGEGKFYAFRSHGAPCSCSCCKQPCNGYKRHVLKAKMDTFFKTVSSESLIEQYESLGYTFENTSTVIHEA